MIEYKVKKKISSASIELNIPSDKPTVFWDTCSLLYIISIPLREAFGEYNVYKQLLKLIEDERIISVTSSIVFDEFKQHADDLYVNLTKEENKLMKILKNYSDLVPGPDGNLIKDAADKLGLSGILVDMSNRVWANTYVINEDLFYQNSAHFRVMHKMSPAREKGEYKDSYIWVTFMDMAKKLGDGNLRAFMTNNTDDYCEFEGKKVKDRQSQIITDCNTVKGELFWKSSELYARLRNVLSL